MRTALVSALCLAVLKTDAADAQQSCDALMQKSLAWWLSAAPSERDRDQLLRCVGDRGDVASVTALIRALRIEERLEQGVTVLQLAGALQSGVNEEALRKNGDRLAAKGQTRIVLNMGRVSFIDSTGLGALVRLYSLTVRRGGEVRLSNLTKPVADLLALTKLSTVIPSYKTEAEAIRSFLIRPVPVPGAAR